MGLLAALALTCAAVVWLWCLGVDNLFAQPLKAPNVLKLAAVVIALFITVLAIF